MRISLRRNRSHQELLGCPDRSVWSVQHDSRRGAECLCRSFSVHQCRELSDGTSEQSISLNPLPFRRARESDPLPFPRVDEYVCVIQCASAIRWAGFKEYIYGTSIETLIAQGWGQIRISSIDVFSQSFDLGTQTRLVGDLLTNETDPYFLWQYNPGYPCPSGCRRGSSGSCTPS